MKNIDIFKKRALFVSGLLFVLFLVGYGYAGYASRLTTWGSGQVLTAASLNAEFDNVLDNGVGVTTAQTLTNKTLTTPVLTVPTIADFSSGTHDHSNNLNGGSLSTTTLDKPIIDNFTSAQHNHNDTENGGFINFSSNTHGHSSNATGGVLAKPIIDNFTSAQHNHGSTSEGGLITGFFAITSIPIGTWNMDGISTQAVAHSLTLDGIRTVFASVEADDHSAIHVFDTNNTGTMSWNATNINLNRVSGGTFDSVGFDDATFNRGWVVIAHEL